MISLIKGLGRYKRLLWCGVGNWLLSTRCGRIYPKISMDGRQGEKVHLHVEIDLDCLCSEPFRFGITMYLGVRFSPFCI